MNNSPSRAQASHGPTSKMEVREQTDKTELAHWLARQALP